eukprot:TRINITY_DN5307_c0_g1_i4.p2 TRINITY_DN5307_c0_g1~~TRINITY_DN5307_c0_g1_i4.p2  ORF type:complete len:107 (-),score=24.45 TRINITY_DN5307_c0_g1_i4:65-340(-)
MCIRDRYRKIMVLIEMMLSVNKNLPCFVGGPRIIPELKERLFPRIQGKDEEYPMLNSGEAMKFIDQLIALSHMNFRTKAYDYFQYCCQGIY